MRSKISFVRTKLVYKFFGNFILVTRFILLPLSQPLKKFTIIYIEIFSKCLRIVIVPGIFTDGLYNVYTGGIHYSTSLIAGIWLSRESAYLARGGNTV